MELEVTQEGRFVCPGESCGKDYKNRSSAYAHIREKHESEVELDADKSFMQKAANVFDTNTVVDKEVVNSLQESLIGNDEDDLTRYTVPVANVETETNNDVEFDDNISLGATSTIMSLRHGELEEMLNEAMPDLVEGEDIVKEASQEDDDDEEEEMAVSCGECGKVFKTEYEASEHMYNVHKDCNSCKDNDGEVSKRDEIIERLTEDLERKDAVIKELSDKLKERRKQNLEKVRKCQMCNAVVKNEQLLKVHMKTHHLEMEKIDFKCSTCKVTVRNKKELIDHRQKPCRTPAPRAQAAPVQAAPAPAAPAPAAPAPAAPAPDAPAPAAPAPAAPAPVPRAPTPAPRRKSIIETPEADDGSEVDCNVCKAVFKNPSDVYTHANKCDNLVSPKICKKCKKELVSKNFLRIHERECQGPVGQKIATVVTSGLAAQAPSTSTLRKVTVPKCTNGENCRWRRQGRCKFEHEGSSSQEVRRSVRKCLNGDQCNLGSMCAAVFSPHMRSNHTSSDICRNGDSCTFLSQNRCRFKHVGFPQDINSRRM